MKTKNWFLYVKTITAFILCFSINSLKAETIPESLSCTPTPHKTGLTETRTSYFNQSIISEVKKIHNDRSIIPTLGQDGSYITSFFCIANELNLNKESLLIGTRLLNNALKQCEIIDDSVINQILTPLPLFLEKHFDEETKKDADRRQLERDIERAMTINITDNLEQFTATPQRIISTLATEIATLSFAKATEQQKILDEQETRERLRQTTLKLVETILSKQIWNRHTYESIWPSVMTTAHSIYQLANHKVINHMDDLDDLYWSLTHRFCFYLDLVGSSLPVSLYNNIEEELKQGTVFFVEMGEQDEGIKTKKEFLMDALMSAKTKALAFAKSGIFTDHQPCE